MKKIVLSLILFIIGYITIAQEYAYPQSQNYPYGYMSSSITSADATAEYESWIEDYYVECSSTEARIDDNGITVSEGIGYGLVITAYAGDKEKFDKLLTYYNKRKNGNGVMDWEFQGCNESPSDGGAATDGDLDAAMGMLVAVHQWPGQGYEQDFESLASAMRNSEFTDCGFILQKPGDAWGGCDCTNPSYYAPGYYRAFAAYYEEKEDNDNASWWSQAADDAYVVLFANQHDQSGLVTAWTNSSGAAGPCGGQVDGGGGSGTYQYDACRTPWRIATDYLWWGNSDAETFLTPMVDFVNTDVGGITEVVDGYDHDGTPTGEWQNVPFVGSFALAAMAVDQTSTDSFLSELARMSGDNYFNTCLSVMYKFLATGNFWNPYGEDPGPTCSQVNLGSGLSLCGIGSAELHAGIPSAQNRTFTWYRNDAQLNSGTENTYTVDQEGTYKVIMDSAGVCSSESSVTITASIPQVDLGPDVTLNTGITLDAGVSGNGLEYTWYKNNTVLSGETEKTVAITEVGTYKVEVSATGCDMQSDEIIVEESPYISKTSSSIDVDGEIDPAYEQFRDLSIELSGTIGTPDIDASWAGLWNDEHLYILVKVTDETISTSAGEWYNNDGVEFFIDGDNSKNSSYDGNNDFQWGFVATGTTVNAGGSNPDNSTSGIEFTTTTTTDGYNIEIAIPWSTINITPHINDIIGLDIAVNDNDGSGRENKIAWHATVDDGWQDPSIFGEVLLTEEQTTEPLQTQTVQLNQGWNMVSFWVLPEDAAIESVFAPLGDNLVQIKTQNSIYIPGINDAYNTLSTIEIGKGYMVYLNSPETLTIEGTPTDAMSTSLHEGWNLVGYPFENENDIQTIINPISSQVSSIKNFEGEYGGNGDLINMQAGKAYFIQVTEDTILDF
ncbi:MAG: glycosyl hydrolase family 8 [Bacteroidales bacterium]